MKKLRLLTAVRITLGVLLILVLAQAFAMPAVAQGEFFVPVYKADSITWEPQGEYDGVILVVSGPSKFQIRKELKAGEIPFLSLFDPQGNRLPDGTYSYELRTMPRLSSAQRNAIQQVIEADDLDARADLALALPQGAVQAAYFSVVDGEILQAATGEGQGLSARRLSTGSQTMNPLTTESGNAEGLTPMAGQVVLTNGDGVIRNSLCVGFDCPDAPLFDDSTILLMENNTRIKFGDTSNAPFPNNDWEIEANSNLSGGANYLGFNDCGTADNDGGCAADLVFAVESGARQNALYVESDGDVGMGTSNPVVNIHAVDGNTPTLRLEQDGSSGFAPQTWDVAGNETNFFIRDVTNGSTLPFRIRPGAPTSAIDIAADGDVGIGTASPGAPLHVRRTNGTAKLFVEEASGTSAARTLMTLENNGAARFVLENGLNDQWSFTNDNVAAGELEINYIPNAGTEVVIDGNGNIDATSFNPTSSRERKQNFQAIDSQEILSRLTELPVTTWSFKGEETNTIHLGPMAEDFKSVFGLGDSDKRINLMDASGVAFAAIQGLHELVREKDQEINQLEQRLAELERLIESLQP